MTAFRDNAAPEVPEYLREPKWHERMVCRVVGHSWRELFDPAGEPFPAYCERCFRSDPAGRSHDDYYAALDRFKRWLDNHAAVAD